MYFEWTLLILDYWKSLNRKNFLFEGAIPMVGGMLLFAFCYWFQDYAAFVKLSAEVAKDFSAILGVLVGFSITVITILTTSDNENINLIKEHVTQVSMGGRRISLYRFLLMNFSYCVVVEAFGLLISLLYPVLPSSINHLAHTILFALLASSVLHVLLLNIRNITSFYFVITTSRNSG